MIEVFDPVETVLIVCDTIENPRVASFVKVAENEEESGLKVLLYERRADKYVHAFSFYVTSFVRKRREYVTKQGCFLQC